jgi:hypothetical protein
MGLGLQVVCLVSLRCPLWLLRFFGIFYGFLLGVRPLFVQFGQPVHVAAALVVCQGIYLAFGFFAVSDRAFGVKPREVGLVGLVLVGCGLVSPFVDRFGIFFSGLVIPVIA